MDKDTAFAERIKRDCIHGDREGAHADADAILCDLLTELGYYKTVEAWRAVSKWYA